MADAPISFEAFSAALLEPWARAPLGDGACITSPREAAARAAYEAAVTHAGAKGTVLVTCSEAASARACLDYLRSFFSDQAQLAKLLKKATPDGVDLHAGTKIVVTTDGTRRPRDLLATIRLSPDPLISDSAVHPVKLHADDETWQARAALHCISHWIHTGEGRDSAMVIAGILHPDDDPSAALDRMKQDHIREQAEARPMSWGGGVSSSAETVGALPNAATTVRQRDPRMTDRDVTSAQWESDRADRMGASDFTPRHQGRATMSTRGRRR